MFIFISFALLYCLLCLALPLAHTIRKARSRKHSILKFWQNVLFIMNIYAAKLKSVSMQLPDKRFHKQKVRFSCLFFFVSLLHSLKITKGKTNCEKTVDERMPLFPFDIFSSELKNHLKICETNLNHLSLFLRFYFKIQFRKWGKNTNEKWFYFEFQR